MVICVESEELNRGWDGGMTDGDESFRVVQSVRGV